MIAWGGDSSLCGLGDEFCRGDEVEKDLAQAVRRHVVADATHGRGQSGFDPRLNLKEDRLPVFRRRRDVLRVGFELDGFRHRYGMCVCAALYLAWVGHHKTIRH